MVLELKLRKIGNSVGIVLPKEALAHMQVEEGDTVCLTEAPDGALRIAASDVEFTRQMEAARNLIDRYRNALRELAK
jgi:putative addiction module antidote